MVKLKGADRKQEYGEKNINKLNHRLDPKLRKYLRIYKMSSSQSTNNGMLHLFSFLII